MSLAVLDSEFHIGPQEGPQTILLSAADVQEAFYGGAMGAGKSYALVLDFERHHQQNGKITGICLRMTVKELDDLINKFKDVLEPLGWEYLEGKKDFRHEDGSVLRMRHCERPRDVKKYWGHEYQWLGVDELGEMPQATCELIQRLRAARLRSSEGKKVRAVLTGNPCGDGHQYCKARYIDPAPPFTPFKAPRSGHTIMFIPGTMNDNPKLLENDPQYRERCQDLGPQWYVDALINGDWSKNPEGNVFKPEHFENTFDLKNPPEFWFVLCSWDTAFKTTRHSARSAGVCLGLNASGIFLLDAYAEKMEFPELIRQTSAMHHRNSPCNQTIIEDKASGQSLDQVMRDEDITQALLDDAPIPVKAVKVDGDKLRRAFAAAPWFESGRFFVPQSAPWLEKYKNELCSFPSPSNPSDQVDATTQGVLELGKIKKRLERMNRKVVPFTGSVWSL